MRDLIIIGKGPAGISAALYAKRANLDVLVIGKDMGALEKAEKIENYFGLERPLSGPALCERGYGQLAALGAQVITDEVLDLSYMGSFQLKGRLKDYESRALLLATGSKRTEPPIPGLKEKIGAGVSSCAVCDAFFFRKKHVAVLGSGPYALHEAELLLPMAASVSLLTNGNPLTADFPPEIPVIHTPIASLYGENRLAGLRFTDDTELPLSGLFLAVGTAGAVDLALKLGAEIEGNRIVTDENMAASLPGLFAAGDCCGGVLQVSTAVAEGAKAALSIVKWLRET